MKKIDEILNHCVNLQASDIFLRPGGPVYARILREIVPIEEFGKFTVPDIEEFIREITPENILPIFLERKDADFTAYRPDSGRFRVSLLYQRNNPAVVLRHIKPVPETFEELNLPPDPLKNLCHEQNGIIMLTGTTGSGKSTTIAAMLQYINHHFNKHILTLEDPIEAIFFDDKSIFNQRQIGLDVSNYQVALRQAILQSPDIIYVANVRDKETMEAVLTAAETGVLVFGTLHTNNAVQSIERMVSFFPPHQGDDIRRRLSLLLKGVISLKLIRRKDGKGLVPAYEILILTPTTASIIRDNELSKLPRYIEDGGIYGMSSLKQSLANLVRAGIISKSTAIKYAESKDELLLALPDIPDDDDNTDEGTYGHGIGPDEGPTPTIVGEYEL